MVVFLLLFVTFFQPSEIIVTNGAFLSIQVIREYAVISRSLMGYRIRTGYRRYTGGCWRIVLAGLLDFETFCARGEESRNKAYWDPGTLTSMLKSAALGAFRGDPIILRIYVP